MSSSYFVTTNNFYGKTSIVKLVVYHSDTFDSTCVVWVVFFWATYYHLYFSSWLCLLSSFQVIYYQRNLFISEDVIVPRQYTCIIRAFQIRKQQTPVREIIISVVTERYFYSTQVYLEIFENQKNVGITNNIFDIYFHKLCIIFIEIEIVVTLSVLCTSSINLSKCVYIYLNVQIFEDCSY